MTSHVREDSPAGSLQEAHGHPGERCKVGAFEGHVTTCIQSWVRSGATVSVRSTDA